MATGSFVNATVATEDTALASAPAPFLVSVAEGGTGATTAAAARTNLGILDYIYPVGSIYMSTASTSPATLFGGTWVRLEDRFLLGAGLTYTAGDTCGEATHTLTIDEMPDHNHSVARGSNIGTNNWGLVRFDSMNSSADTTRISHTGGGLPHNNMPPYLAVYMWERTA